MLWKIPKPSEENVPTMQDDIQKSEAKSVLFVVHFQADKGGIARVGRLMYQSLNPHRVVSLFGSSEDFEEENAVGCKGSIFRYIGYLIWFILIHGVREWYFDHLGKASVMLLIPKRFIKKLVIFLHDEEAWSKVTGRHRKTLNLSTRLICNSQYTYDRFVGYNPEWLKITRVCLLAGVPVLFQTQASGEPLSGKFDVWFSGQRNFCLFVSRLWKEHRYKGYLELLEAFAMFKHAMAGSELNLVIVGRGDDEPFVQQRIQELGLSACVVHFNDVDDLNLLSFYKACSVLFFPSSREGFGFVFLEAMFLAKACIGLAGQPAEEIIIHEKTGLLIPDNQPETMMEVLKDIEINPATYKKYGQEGKALFLRKFTNEHFRRRFIHALYA